MLLCLGLCELCGNLYLYEEAAGKGVAGPVLGGWQTLSCVRAFLACMSRMLLAVLVTQPLRVLRP